MTIRVRFDITWTITRRAEGPEVSVEDCIARARSLMLGSFPSFAPEVRFQVSQITEHSDEIRALWDVDLSDRTTLYRVPEDHVAALQGYLVRDFAQVDSEIDVQIWRKADPSEAVDHGEIHAFYGAEAEQDDYPVFRPEPHPEWEEADKVFLQDGVWWWCVSEEMAEGMDPLESRGPAVGPDPVAIFTPWEPDFLARREATARRAAERSRLFSAAA